MATYKVLTDLVNTFFTDNIITVSFDKPTNGTWRKNDIVIATSINNKIWGWMCIESGTPGRWMELQSNVELTGDVTSHNHDSRYYTKNEILKLLSSIATAEHNHDDRYYTKSQIIANYYDKEYINNVLKNISGAAHTHSWSEITNKPLRFPAELGITSSTAFRGDYGYTAYLHALSQHAPANAQKNSDITIYEIEAKLIGNLTSHNHDSFYYRKNEIDNKFSSYAPRSHNHDDRYYTKYEIDNKIYVQQGKKLWIQNSDPGSVGAGSVWIKTS